MSTAPKFSPKQISDSNIYTWTVPGAPVRIHLHLSVVEALGREVRRAFEFGASNGAEIGGLLLGKGDPHGHIVEIRDFEPLLFEGRPDRRFVLSGSERSQLETKLEARKSIDDSELNVVGFYRSQIGHGLSLSEQDLAFAQACFYSPANVFLVVEPSSEGTLSAGFFFWDNGLINSESTFLEFPFDADQLATAEPIDELSPADLATSAVFPTPEGAISGELPGSPTAKGPVYTLRKLAGTLLLWARATPIMAGGAAALMIAMAALTYSAYRRSPALGLKVERHLNDLRVTWSRNTPLIHNAQEAVLSIRDGDLQPQKLYLDFEQLRNASVFYTPNSAKVQFRLEVTAPDKRKTSEAVLALAAPKTAPSLPAARNQAKPVAPDASRETVGTQIRSPLAASPPTVASASPRTSAVIEQLALSPRDLAALPVPSPQHSASVGKANARQPSPALSSEQGQFSADSTFVAPRPIRQSQPKLPPEIRATLTSEAVVQVKVKIDELGRVVDAEPMGSTGPASSSLVTTSQNAARLWRFAPATRGNQAVASVAILRFIYRPEVDGNSTMHSR